MLWACAWRQFSSVRSFACAQDTTGDGESENLITNVHRSNCKSFEVPDPALFDIDAAKVAQATRNDGTARVSYTQIGTFRRKECCGRGAVADSVANSGGCCARNLCGLGGAGNSRATDTGLFISSGKERLGQCGSAGQSTGRAFPKSEPGGSEPLGPVRLRHG